MIGVEGSQEKVAPSAQIKVYVKGGLSKKTSKKGHGCVSLPYYFSTCRSLNMLNYYYYLFNAGMFSFAVFMRSILHNL